MRRWLIHILNQVDRRTEDLRQAAALSREAMVRAERAGWLEDRKIDPETRREVEEEGVPRLLRQVAGDLMELARALDKGTELWEREQRGEDVEKELEALKKKLEALRL